MWDNCLHWELHKVLEFWTRRAKFKAYISESNHRTCWKWMCVLAWRPQRISKYWRFRISLVSWRGLFFGTEVLHRFVLYEFAQFEKISLKLEKALTYMLQELERVLWHQSFIRCRSTAEENIVLLSEELCSICSLWGTLLELHLRLFPGLK